MFAILLSFLFATNTIAAPTQTFTAPWANIRSDKTLVRFQSTLLNSTLLTFLDDCFSPNISNKIEIPCSHYFDAIKQLNTTNFVVQQPAFDQLLSNPSKEEDFCTKHHFPGLKYYQTSKSTDFSNPTQCGYFCVQENMDKIVPKPICAFLAWMGDEIQNYNVTTATKASVVAIKKTEFASQTPVKDDQAVSVGKPGSSSIQSESNKQAVSKLKTKEESLADSEKQTLSKDKQSAGITQNVQTEQKLEGKAENKSTAIPEVDSPKQDLTVQKNNSAKVLEANAPASNSPAAAAAGAGSVIISKEETIPSQAVKETKDDANPSSNADAEQEESPPQESPDNPKKHDSLPNEEVVLDNDSGGDLNEEMNNDENDDDPDDMEISQQKLSKDAPLAAPEENDVDIKSQEIIDRNYLRNTNHVKDPFQEESGSNFFTYFLIGMFLCIILYVVYHNKSKILALLLEGRRNDKGRSGRRKHTAAYRKLDSNLEEAITSSASGRTTQIIY